MDGKLEGNNGLGGSANLLFDENDALKISDLGLAHERLAKSFYLSKLEPFEGTCW